MISRDDKKITIPPEILQGSKEFLFKNKKAILIVVFCVIIFLYLVKLL